MCLCLENKNYDFLLKQIWKNCTVNYFSKFKCLYNKKNDL